MLDIVTKVWDINSMNSENKGQNQMNNLTWAKETDGSGYVARCGSLFLNQEDLANYPQSQPEQYAVSIQKEGSSWIIFAEDHEPTDMNSEGEYRKFKTLKEAKADAQEWAEEFWYCVQQQMAEDDARYSN